MTDPFQSVFAFWDFPPVVSALLVLTALIYIRGWRLIRRTRPALFPGWRLGCFLGGMAALEVAVASPLDTLGDRLLFMHMTQHYVFMSVAPPLLALSAPVVPMLRGLPRWVVRHVLGPIFMVRAFRKFSHALVQLRPAWLLMNLCYLGWHVPKAYEFALRYEGWHNCEHACFFFSSLLFWWPILEPWPFRARFNHWLLLPYLLSADIVNTGVSAFLVFADRVVYPSYAREPRLFGISALNDQAAAGAFMWVFGSTVFLVPFFLITLQLLSNRGPFSRRARAVRHSAAL